MRAPGPKRPVATIWGAQGFRVRLTYGIIRTNAIPTSVPKAQRQSTTEPMPVSCTAGRPPPEPASASPAGLIFTPTGRKYKPRPHEGGGIFNRNVADLFRVLRHFW